MRLRNIVLGLILSAAALVEMLSSSPAAAASKPFSGSGSYTLATINFSYDGVTPAVLLTGSETSTLGPATFQVISETAATTNSCTAPDGTMGTVFNLVRSDAAGTWKMGQIYFTAGASPDAQCVSSTTGSNGGTIVYTITGGTGAFVGVSGSTTLPFTGQTLAAGGTPPGSGGVFGAGQFSFSGTISK